MAVVEEERVYEKWAKILEEELGEQKERAISRSVSHLLVSFQSLTTSFQAVYRGICNIESAIATSTHKSRKSAHI